MKVAADSSVLIAAVASWHEHHGVALDALDEPLSEDRLVLPVPAVIESYAVLTRLPSPFRVAPRDAYEALESSFRSISLSGFPTRSAWSFLQSLVGRDVVGGSTYDASIVRAALAGGASAILTFNRRHFFRFADEIAIIDPSS